MPDDSPQDPNLDDQEKNYFRGLIKEGLDIDEMVERSGESRATIYRRFAAWNWKRGWIELDAPDNAPAAPKNNGAPTNGSPSHPPPNTSPAPPRGDLLTPEVRAKMEALKKKRRQP